MRIRDGSSDVCSSDLFAGVSSVSVDNRNKPPPSVANRALAATACTATGSGPRLVLVCSVTALRTNSNAPHTRVLASPDCPAGEADSTAGEGELTSAQTATARQSVV